MLLGSHSSCSLNIENLQINSAYIFINLRIIFLAAIAATAYGLKTVSNLVNLMLIRMDVRKKCENSKR